MERPERRHQTMKYVSTATGESGTDGLSTGTSGESTGFTLGTGLRNGAPFDGLNVAIP